LIARALQIRNAHAALFQRGSYEPLQSAGRFKANVIAFARAHKNQRSITVVPRFLTRVVKENHHPLGRRIWGDTEILIAEKKNSRWKDIFTEERLSAKLSLKIGDIFRHFPCALLLRKDTE
jgi:(1->4)-alpha-D-glucan 1-alpha-D-glucosylmutase